MLKKLFGNRMRRSLFVLAVLVLVVHFLDSRGYLHGLQMAFGLDPMLQQGGPVTPIDVSIVKISDEEYKNYFCSQSPLDARGVLALVKVVHEKIRPVVIGVDLDTSDWKLNDPPTSCPRADVFPCTSAKPQAADKRGDQACLKKEIDQMLPGGGVPAKYGHPSAVQVGDQLPSGLVWAQVTGDPEPAPGRDEWWALLERAWNVLWEGQREERTMLPLQPVAGKVVPADSLASGIPRFPLDADGVVRRYRRRFLVVDRLTEQGSPHHAEPREMNSLPHALAKACETCIGGNREWRAEEDHHSDEDLILRFIDPRTFIRIDAKYLLPVPREGGSNAAPDNIEKAAELIHSPIVLIGGTYKGARDTYRTPLGEMAGVELLAQAVETDLHQGTRELSGPGKILADIAAGLLVIFLWNSKFISRHLSLRAIFAISLFGIFLAFRMFSSYLFRHGIWLDSIAILVGVVLHQITEEFDKIEEGRKEIAEARKQREEDQDEIACLEARIRELEE